MRGGVMRITAAEIQHQIDTDPKLRDAQREHVGLRNIAVVDAATFLQMQLPERELLLSPWLPAQGLAMVYAPRGIGKTFFALNVAYAVASGGGFLGWKASAARRVLYLDGEMPANVMQERLADIVRQHTAEAPPDNFQIVTPDLQPLSATPNLSSVEGQSQIDPLLADVALVVIDNISTLCRGGVENDAESWLPVQNWALRLRSRGISVLFVHHAGKGGNQRGTSKREDVLDTVINLKRPADYSPEDGAKFEVHFEKARGFTGTDAEPIEASIAQSLGDGLTWCWRPLEDSTFDRVIELHREGLQQVDIARELEVNRSTVSRHLKRAKAQGLLGGA
jgi:hypothetical protein